MKAITRWTQGKIGMRKSVGGEFVLWTDLPPDVQNRLISGRISTVTRPEHVCCSGSICQHKVVFQYCRNLGECAEKRTLPPFDKESVRRWTFELMRNGEACPGCGSLSQV